MSNFKLIAYHFMTYDYLVSSVRQHFHNTIVISFGYQRIDVEVALPFVSFFGKYVSGVRVAALNLASRGGSETLRRALMCF